MKCHNQLITLKFPHLVGDGLHLEECIAETTTYSHLSDQHFISHTKHRNESYVVHSLLYCLIQFRVVVGGVGGLVPIPTVYNIHIKLHFLQNILSYCGILDHIHSIYIYTVKNEPPQGDFLHNNKSLARKLHPIKSLKFLCFWLL